MFPILKGRKTGLLLHCVNLTPFKVQSIFKVCVSHTSLPNYEQSKKKKQKQRQEC